jgi:hypothetical protein
VPAILKYYRVESSADRPLVKFSMQRLDRRAPRIAPEALLAAPAEAEAWAHIDLPNVPGHKAKPALRAPLTVTCAGCHGRYPRAFNPGTEILDTAQYRLTTEPQQFTAERTMDLKSLSAEYAALRYYFTSELLDPEDPASTVVPGTTPNPDPPSSLVSLLRRYSLIGLAASAILAFVAAWARRGRSTSSPPGVTS